MRTSLTAGHTHIGDDLIFVGRGALLEEQANRIRSNPSYVGVLYGPSGVGKSEFSRHLIASFNRDESPEIEAILFEIEPAQAPEEPFLDLYDCVYKEAKPSAVGSVWRALRQDGVMKGIKIGVAIAKDYVARHLGSMENTATALGDIAQDSVRLPSTAKLRAEVGGSNFSKLIDKLNVAAKRTPTIFVLVLDGMERASEASLALIDSLLRRLPSNVRLLLTVNSEAPEFDSASFRTLKSRLQYYNAEGIIEFPGLTAADIVAWKRQIKGTTISTELAEQARDVSDGRPLLLKPWIESDALGVEHLRTQSGRLSGYYQERFNALSDGEKTVGRVLATSYPHALPRKLLPAACGLPMRRVEHAIDRLKESGFGEEVKTGIRSKHALIASFLVSQMGVPLTEEYKERLYHAISTYSPRRVSDPGTISRLAALKSDVIGSYAGAEGMAFMLAFAARMLRLGAYRQATQKLDVADQMLRDGVQVGDQEKGKLELLRAEIDVQIGAYDAALQWAENANRYKLDEATRTTIFLVQADAYFYLNRYGLAVRHFKDARTRAKQIRDARLWARSIVRLAGITMDVGKWSAARHIGHVLMDSVLPQISTDDLSTRCHILRTVARIEAPHDQHIASVRIQEALDLAGSLGSDKVLGNCLFAQAEVLRHAGENEQAHSSYSRALGIAEDIGNKDLAVYCIMGLVVLSLIGADASFTERVGKLAEAVNYDAPAEQANVDLFLAIRRKVQGKKIDPEAWSSLEKRFRELKRHWQISLINAIKDSQTATLAEVSQAMRGIRVVF